MEGQEVIATETVSLYVDVAIMRARLLNQEDPEWARVNLIHRLFRCTLQIGEEVPFPEGE